MQITIVKRTVEAMEGLSRETYISIHYINIRKKLENSAYHVFSFKKLRLLTITENHINKQIP